MYRKQVDLLLMILPYIEEEKQFALKGGTAINLFLLDLPRLSVDIDLTYLPFDSRDTALGNIKDGLRRIGNSIESRLKGSHVKYVTQSDGNETKLNCFYQGVHVKVEVNSVMRGHIYPTEFMQTSEAVQKQFGKFAAIQTLSKAELYGGKICAALDRQHPRDLFDICCFLETQRNINTATKNSFMAFLMSHPRPIHEVLMPTLLNMEPVYERQFKSMSKKEFDYSKYEDTRSNLIETLKDTLTLQDIEFLISFEKGNPQWDLVNIPQIQKLPAALWKQINIQKLKKNNPHKHMALLEEFKQKAAQYWT